MTRHVLGRLAVRPGMNVRRLPVAVRLVLLIAATGLGLALGFVIGLGMISVVVGVIGHQPSRTPLGLLIVGSAYGITGLTGLAAFVVAWLRLFRPRA